MCEVCNGEYNCPCCGAEYDEEEAADLQNAADNYYDILEDSYKYD